ncbi:MAG: acyl-ACP--UDP-N-acetylglucosamine O-acyltransferase [Planctomycetes bacterium]|nr:acyl-ACP--UDP-N-acetylglucosamine O-acyltransferase [Planctomycetota bacterium]
MATKIHPTAVVDRRAELGSGVEVGPYSILGARVTVGDDTIIGPQVVIEGVTTIGARNRIVGQASLGGPPQDFSYKGEPTELAVGDDNLIREFVTINRGTVKGGAITRVGSSCLLMACSHVAHDCQLEDKVILANNVMLAGHVLIGRGANISGGVGAHHFCTVGEFAYVGGLTRLERDVPPFMVVEGHRARVRNVNSVGLMRNGFDEDEVESLKDAFRLLFRSRKPLAQAMAELRHSEGQSPSVRHLLESLERTERGKRGRYRESLREEFAREGAERIASGATL